MDMKKEIMEEKKNYQIPCTDVARMATTDMMQLSVASGGGGGLPPGSTGNAPKRRGGVF